MFAERPFLVLIDLECLLDLPTEMIWHRQALEDAVRDVCGLDVSLPARRAGHTDYSLVCAALAQIEMTELLTEECFDLICRRAGELYARECPAKLFNAVRPGAEACLAQLRDHPQAALVPLSGAAPEIARILIERAGLERLLAVGFGSFAEFERQRPDLFDRARRRAGGQAGISWPLERTIYVTGCPEDAIAARTAQITTVGIGGEAGPRADWHLMKIDELPALIDELGGQPLI